MDDLQPVSILLLGDDGVGKSTFLSRLAQLRRNGSLENAAASQGANSVTLLRDSDQPFVLEIRSRIAAFRLEFSDTASPENWRCLQPDLVVLCYDISRRPTLTSLQTRWIGEVRTVFPHRDRVPILVLGLKRDLRVEDDPEGTLYPHEAYNLSQQLRADMYMECSAVTGELMPQVVDDICRRAVKTASPEGGQSEGSCSVM